jgi:hypothetical protein
MIKNHQAAVAGKSRVTAAFFRPFYNFIVRNGDFCYNIKTEALD